MLGMEIGGSDSDRRGAFSSVVVAWQVAPYSDRLVYRMKCQEASKKLLCDTRAVPRRMPSTIDH